jgi:hypothetical protein
MLFGGATTFANAEDSALVPGLRRDTWEVVVAAAQPGPGPDQPQPGQVEVASVSVQPDAVSNAGDVIDVFVQLTAAPPTDVTLIAAIFADDGTGNWMPVQPPGFDIPSPIGVSGGTNTTQFPIMRDSNPLTPGPHAIGVGVESSGMMQAGFFTVN